MLTVKSVRLCPCCVNAFPCDYVFSLIPLSTADKTVRLLTSDLSGSTQGEETASVEAHTS